MNRIKAWKPLFAPIDLKDATVVIKDGAAATVTVKIGTGSIDFSESYVIEYVLNQGKLDTAKRGDETPMDVTLAFTWEWVQSTTGSVREIITNTTGAVVGGVGADKKNQVSAGFTSTDPDPCAPYACDIVLTNAPSCAAVTTNEVFTLGEFRAEKLAYNSAGSSISVTGKCNFVAPQIVYTP